MTLFLHGLNRRGACWAPLLHAPVWGPSVTPDHPGHGAGARLSRYKVLDYLPAVLAQVDARPGAILFGHSLGAMLALAAAAERPESVRAIVLEDPPFQTMGRRLPGTDLHTYFQALVKAAGHAWPLGEAVKHIGALTFQAKGETRRVREVRDATQLRLMAAFLRQVDRRAVEEVLDGNWLEGYDEGELAGRVRCPVLLFQSDPAAGGMLTDEDAERMAASGADVTLVKLPGVGHQAHWQAPELLLRHGLAFVTALESSR
jgi:pimeloyl-ACP methyl ester carboxylesterase